MHVFAASGAGFATVLGPAELMLRTPEAIVLAREGRMRIEADCSTGGPWVDCGLYFRRRAM
eukprot:8741189-Alexandrium_andersonii.AAC.1